MKPNKSHLWIALPAALVLGLFVLSPGLPAGKKEGPARTVRFIAPIKTDPQTWLADQVDAGKDVYLSANYLFQVMKLRSQKVLMEFEAATLYPTLMEITDGLKEMGVKTEALVFVEMARRLLNPEAEVEPEFAEEVEARVTAFTGDPQNAPRGHYTTSEELKRYFRGMQFLAKATFDVNVDKQWFGQRMYMLFPFEAAVELINGLADPRNAALLERFSRIHTFYDRFVGKSDLPAFHDLVVDKPQLSPQAVLEYATSKGLPKINKEMGVGIQCLGERFAAHQSIIENLSQKFLAQETTVNRAKAFEVLQFKNIFVGRRVGKAAMPGLVATKADMADPNISYYDLCLGAIIGLPQARSSVHMMNTTAACLTALSEQTILVTKQTTIVPKSAPFSEEKEQKSVRIYVQPGIENFIKNLSAAETRLYSECGMKPAADAYTILISASTQGKPIRSDSPEGIKVLDLVAPLSLDPTVTADVFCYSGPSDKAFLQWAIGPFEVEYILPNKTKVRGMEMVFFEGWHDTARPGAEDPMTNEAWRSVFAQGQYPKLRSFVLDRLKRPARPIGSK